MEETPKVFISYSREDSGFARELTSGLELDKSYRVLLDQKDIEAGDDWRARLGALIVDADTVIFVLSPRSVASAICNWEIEEAERLSKRILPVLAEDLGSAELHPLVKARQYVRFDPEPGGRPRSFMDGLGQLKRALDANMDWHRQHTRLLKRALEWIAEGEPSAKLVTGEDLPEARKWLLQRPGNTSEPSEMHRRFVAASEREADDRANKGAAIALRRRLVVTRWGLTASLLSILAGTAYGYLGYQRIVAQHANELEIKNREKVVALDEAAKDKAKSLEEADQGARQALRSIAADALRRVVAAKREPVAIKAVLAKDAGEMTSEEVVERIGKNAFEMIIRHEVGSEANYRRMYSKPTRPLNNSGITIGVGYDLSAVRDRQLRSDWADLQKPVLDRLAAVVAKSGREAEALYPGVQDIEIPYEAAIKVFRERTLVQFARRTEAIYPQVKSLPSDCYGALVSLVLNRGDRLVEDSQGSRAEMQGIQKLLEVGEYYAIPDQIRAMKWMWWKRRNVAGLMQRRDDEATLFESCTKALQLQTTASR